MNYNYRCVKLSPVEPQLDIAGSYQLSLALIMQYELIDDLFP